MNGITRSPGGGARWVWVLFGAMAAALVGWAFAPTDWPTGEGAIEVSVGGTVVFREPVVVGDPTAIEQSGADGLIVSLPGGVPTDAPIRVELAGVEVAQDVSVDIALPDGTVEPIPLSRFDDDMATAVRRPPVDARVVTALVAAVIVLWISEVWPLHATALLVPVVLAVGGVGSSREVFAPFFDPIIVLFFAGFLMAQAMHRVQLDRLAAVSIVSLVGSSPVRLYAALLALSAFMSMWMSNTAAVTVLLPVVMAVTAPLAHIGYRKACLLGVAYAATIGGVGTLVGTPANPLAARFIFEVTGERITFVDWLAFGLPMVVVFVPVMGVYLWWISRVRVDSERFKVAQEIARSHRAEVGRIMLPQGQVLAVFVAVLAVWLTQEFHGISPGIAALGGALALTALGKIEVDDLGRISWSTLLTFGGGLTMGVFMVSSGVSDHFVTRLGWLAAMPTWLGVVVAAVVTLVATTLASNTASAATLIPLAFPLAAMIGVDPVFLVAVVAITSSIDFALVIGTPPTMLAYSTGLFDVREILRKGSLLDAVGIALLVTVVAAVWGWLGLV